MGKMVNVLCLSPQFAKNQKSNDLQKSSFSPAATNDWQHTSQWVQTVKLFRGPQPGPPAGRPSGGGVGRGCAAPVRCRFISLSFGFPGTNPAHN